VAGSLDWVGKIRDIDKMDEDCRNRFIPVGEQREIRENRDRQLQAMQESCKIQEDILQTIKER
jgi:hypothetical protein